MTRFLRASLSCLLWISLMLAMFPLAGQSPAELPERNAAKWFKDLRKDFQLTEADLDGMQFTDQYQSNHNGIQHFYLQQKLQGIAVFGAYAQVHLDDGDQPAYVHSDFIPHLADKINRTNPQINSADALSSALSALNIPFTTLPEVMELPSGPNQVMKFYPEMLALEPIEVQLVFQPISEVEVRLAWLLSIYTADAQHWYRIRIDAENGQVLGTGDWVVSEHSSVLSEPQYRVFEPPTESPLYGLRVLRCCEADPVASPFGWHDTDGQAGPEHTTTKGNNVDAYEDRDMSNYPTIGDNARADGGTAMNFDFSIDFSQEPVYYGAASITNLFYWNNTLHDYLYHYGFDEQAGNFQHNNYGHPGHGNDAILAEAQDGRGTNNANFAAPPDGHAPRMQMFLWDMTTPMRDAALDNAIIAHEYGHGLSLRLTGGPSNSDCLSNSEQPGEGWSDWLALIFSLEAGDQATDARGLGNYVLGQSATDPGIRPAAYSTDMTINDYTYGDLSTLPAPHGTGFVWATMLWEMTWAFIDEYGFDPDWINGDGGNQMALQLVIDGLKLQPCQSGFVDARDAILKADEINNGGIHQCLIWKAFAKRGLGYSAMQNSPWLVNDGQEAFDIPPSCRKELHVDMAIAADSMVAAGEALRITVTATNYTDEPLSQVMVESQIPSFTQYTEGSVTGGGILSGDRLFFPPVSLASGESIQYQYLVQQNGSLYTAELHHENQDSQDSPQFSVEKGAGPMEWVKVVNSNLGGDLSWFAYGISGVSDQYLIYHTPFVLGEQAALGFHHRYTTECSMNFGHDGGVVEYSLDGQNWIDLGPNIIENGYTKPISEGYGSPIEGRMAFTGTSPGYIRTLIDLGHLANTQPMIRFRIATDSTGALGGWYIDDMYFYRLINIFGQSCAQSAQGDVACGTLPPPGVIVIEPNPFPVNWLEIQANATFEGIQLQWAVEENPQNTGFEVLRSSDDHMNFSSPLDFVSANGVGSGTAAYQYLDQQVLPGQRYYYQVRQIDQNGLTSLSPIVSASLSDDPKLQMQVFPNPADQILHIQLRGRTQHMLSLHLLNATGQIVREVQLHPDEIHALQSWDISGLTGGIYLLHLRQAGQVLNQKIVVE